MSKIEKLSCRDCKIKKVKVFFAATLWKKGTEKGHSVRCKECFKVYDYGRKYTYKGERLTREIKERLWVNQNSSCAICQIQLEDDKNLESSLTEKKFVVDHDYQSRNKKEVRGILCTKCNTGIGKLGESDNVLLGCLRAARYVYEKAEIYSKNKLANEECMEIVEQLHKYFEKHFVTK